MRLFGKVVFLFAQLFLYKDCKKLKVELVQLYSEYDLSIRPKMSPIFSEFLIVAEDRRFFRHSGIDIFAIIRAIYRFLFYRELSGASTIQQQLVRTIQRRYEKSFRRKLREMMLATIVSEVIERHEIPNLYLYIAYLGWRMNGLEQACRRLDIDIALPTPQQAAAIVARLKYPEPEFASPRRLQQITNRTQYLLSLFLATQINKRTILSQAEAADAAIQR